ncbi:hypothetical protein EWM64_g6583 [Hericium alpestre]|uniref:Uncharacterized protein n=1 Tax=Hericium alpestre TaxID=135208 RepID=A0A4Y9ZRM8_9AGAM|nr:hypothetical protein EWM64_g6583 [Hericium alpestre]
MLRYLDITEVLRCTLVSKAFSALIKQSLELQYKIELFADGMIDNPASVLSIAQRLQVLLDRRRAWERLDIRKSVKLSIHDDCLAYELVGGVFATVGDPSSDHTSLGNSQFIASWLPTASIDEHRVVYRDMGIPVKDFAIDPTQDLLALVERHPDVFGQAMDGLAAPFHGDIRIHLRSLSTNMPHGLARTPILRHPSGIAVSESTTQIAHDVVGMFLSRPFAGLIIWNWKSGETLLHTSHAPQAISDFSFLSPRAYLLTAYDGDGSLEVFTFSNDEVNATAAHHAATLRLPPLTVEAGIGRINTHTGPFTARIPRDAPFDVDSDTRIHVLTLFYVRPVGRMVRLIVDHRVFLPYINQHHDGGAPVVKAWKEWGPKHSRAFRFRQWSHWLRPIIQGGMQWVGVPPLVAAVSEAGGLGVLTALTQPSPDALREAIREVRRRTSKPFGVNITILPTINPPDYEGYARAAVEEGVRIFETAGNNPGPLIQYFKANGAVVIHKCTTIRHAKSAEKRGIDILSIDGFECAGHPGEEDVGGLVLFARAAQELKIPFIASGGIADSRGFAAALALGAEGVNMGTRFMCTVESSIHQNIKEKIVSATEQDTVHIFRTLGNTARVFKNKVAQEVVALERRPGGAKFEDLRDLVSGIRGRVVYEKGDPEYGVWSAGVTIGLIHDIPTCGELVSRMEREAEEIIEGMSKLRKPKPKL